MPNFLPAFIIFNLWAGSLSIAVLPYFWFEPQTLILKVLCLSVAAPIFGLSFLSLAGLLSYPSQHAIIRGRFPRENFHRIYFWRRIYGCCWASVFYFKPLYFVFLSIPILRKTMFRLFGYRGQLQFTIYPDSWIRDLPLLQFGKGSYCSNRATLGSNMCLQDGTILVDRIVLGDRSVVGHLAMLAPGVRLGHDVEIGAGAALGIRCRMSDGARVGASCSFNHGAMVGARTEVGGHSCLGLRAEIGPDLNLPVGSMVPAGASVKTQADVDHYFSTENQRLKAFTNDIAKDLKAAVENMTFHE